MQAIISLFLALVLPSTAAASGRITSYVFVNGSMQTMMTGGNMELEQALRIRDRENAPFLWFRTPSGTFVIRDRATLNEVSGLFAPLRAQTPERQRLQQRMRPLQDRERELDRQIDALDEDDSPASRERRTTLTREMRDIESRLRVFEKEEDRLDRDEERLEAEAERAMAPVLERSVRSGVAVRVR